jgi:hypothetical protein
MAAVEALWHGLRQAVNARHPIKRESSLRRIRLVRQAWADTSGGTVCPPRPW